MAKKKKFVGKVKKVLLGLFFIFLALIISFAIYNFYFLGQIYPNTLIAGLSVSGRTKEEVVEILKENIEPLSNVSLVAGEQEFIIDLTDLGFSYDFPASSVRAFNLTRSGNVFLDFYNRGASIFKKSEVGLSFNLDEAKFNETILVVGSQISDPPIEPSVKFAGGKVLVEKGQSGTKLDTEEVVLKIFEGIAKNDRSPVFLALKSVDPSLSEEESENLRVRAEKISKKSLSFGLEFDEIVFSGEKLFSFLDPRSSGYGEQKINEVTSETAGKVARPPQDPVFVFEEGKVKEFAPAKEGITLKKETFKEMLIGNLTTLETADTQKIAVDLPVEKIPSKIKTGEVNNLGIKELVGRGTSRFSGSISNRIYNIGLASSRFKGILVKPGETFSFNDVLGDVSSYTGYKQAFVIKDGRTVLGDGGGVCQVSTTLFRAILDAGLPVVERRAHSYRVGYYEQDSPAGLDATVFAPTTDLKFKNDTPGHLLIQPIFDAKTQSLVFEIYGTSDGREATISKPLVSGITAPPPDLYIDDPALPVGTIKQIDFKASGARASFNYQVSRNGEEIYSKSFVSSYRPWQAIFLRGTGAIQ